MNRFLSIIILVGIFLNAFAQDIKKEPQEKARALSLDEISQSLVGKEIKYLSTSNGVCKVQFRKDSTLNSSCDGGSGVGNYKIGLFNAKGGDDGSVKPRFCMVYTYKPNDIYCSILYERADGRLSFNAGKTVILEVTHLN